MPPRDPDEEFEFLVNLLASDGVDPGPSPAADATGLQEEKNADGELRIQRGSDGRLDLDQVRAFYERKNMGKEKGKGVGRVGLTDSSPRITDRSRNRSGRGRGGYGEELNGEGDISASRLVSESGDQTVVSPLGELGPTPASRRANTMVDRQGSEDWKTSSSGSEGPGKWVDLISEKEAKQLLIEISEALRLKVPPDSDPRSATDGPRTLNDVKNVVEFLVRIDELVWRRSEYGSDHGVFDSKNILAVEERVRLWERIARGSSSS